MRIDRPDDAEDEKISCMDISTVPWCVGRPASACHSEIPL